MQSALIEDERVTKLLDLLQKRDNSLFPRFCEALISTGQRHVVDYLLSDIETSSASIPGAVLKCLLCLLRCHIFISFISAIYVFTISLFFNPATSPCTIYVY